MSLRSVALFYGHVARNIGDLAINLGTLNLVRSVFPDARLRVVLLDVENSPICRIRWLRSARPTMWNSSISPRKGWMRPNMR